MQLTCPRCVTLNLVTAASKDGRQVPSRGNGVCFQLNQVWGTTFREKQCEGKISNLFYGVVQHLWWCFSVCIVYAKRFVSLSRFDSNRILCSALRLPFTDSMLNWTQRRHNLYENFSPPSGAHSALSAYTAQQQTYTHTLMLKSKAVRPSTHIWSGLAQVQISPNQTPRTLFHTPSPFLPLPLQYAWPRRLRSFHPHSHGNSFSLARGRRQPRVQLAGFTLEILFITLAAMLISCSVVLSLPLSHFLSLSHCLVPGPSIYSLS